MRLALPLVFLAATATAEPVSPAPGTAARADLLDTLRVAVGLQLGGPVEFVVDDLRVDGDRAFALVTARRPGGGAIDLAQTPLHLRDGRPLEEIDGPAVAAYLYRAAGDWYVDAFTVGATDAWWLSGPDCAVFFPGTC